MDHLENLAGKYFVFTRQLDIFTCSEQRTTINPGALCKIEKNLGGNQPYSVHFVRTNNNLSGTAYHILADNPHEFLTEISAKDIEEILNIEKQEIDIIKNRISKLALEIVKGKKYEYKDNI